MSADRKGCILVSRNDLFGARMLPFMNALRIGHDYGLPVKIYWPTLASMDTNIGEHTDIFSAEFIAKHFISHEEFNDLNKDAIGLTQMRKTPATEIVQMVRDGSVMALNGVQTALCLGGEDEALVAQSYRATLDRISFTDVTKANIDRIHAATKGQEFLAYHVRHGDVTTTYRAKNKPWPNKFIPNAFYVQHFNEHVKKTGKRAMLFGDLQPSLDWLCEQCPDLIQISDVIEFGKLGSLQRDFLELYAMSRAVKIVGPNNSGFSQLASSLGGVEFCDIVTDLTPNDSELAFDEMSKLIASAPEQFSSNGEIAQNLAHLGPYLLESNRALQAADLISREIKRGNTITYLFPMLARCYLQIEAHQDVLETRNRSLSEPMFDPLSIADLDAMAAKAAFSLGDSHEACRLLTLALFQTPYARHVRDVFKLLDRKSLLTSRNCFPIDRDLMRIITPNNQVFHPVFFAWEWRHSLISDFQRPLTHAGAADLLSKQIDQAFRGETRTDDLQASFKSFQSLLLMGRGHTEKALELSMDAIDMAPKNQFVLKRHIQNLLYTRTYDIALRFAQELVALEPKVPAYRNLLGDCLVGLKKRHKAIAAFEPLHVGRPHFPSGVARHAGFLVTTKRPDAAVNLLDRFLPELRWPDMYLELQTAARLANGTQNHLLPFLLNLEKEGFQSRKVSHLIAKIKRANGDPKGALPHAELALRYSPNLIKFKEVLAHIYVDLGRMDKARPLYDQMPDGMKKRFKSFS